MDYSFRRQRLKELQPQTKTRSRSCPVPVRTRIPPPGDPSDYIMDRIDAELYHLTGPIQVGHKVKGHYRWVIHSRAGMGV